MGIIELYDALSHLTETRLSPPISDVQITSANGHPIVDDSKVVTLAEFDPVSKNAITAHHLKDYRRKNFNLTLLPDVHILLDDIMEGSAYWYAKLHNESPYT